MADEEVKVTFESIYDILREEKKSEELTKLDPNYIIDVASYLKEKLNSALVEDELSQKQISSIKRMISEIFDRREAKLIRLAMHAARLNSNFVDKSRLLSHEMELFSKINEIIGKNRQNILDKIIKAETEHIKQMQIDLIHSNNQNEQNSNEQEESIQSKDLKINENFSDNKDAIRIVFTKNISKFVGENMEIYGPYSKDDEAELPKKIANILIQREQASPFQN